MINNKKTSGNRQSQRGFSLVELLVAAAIMAIGILGLTMLQAMSMKASRGSTNMVMAARIAEKIMDQVELEGRLSWLNITDSNRTSPPSLENLEYISLKSGEIGEPQKYNLNGNPVMSGGDSSDDPRDSVAFFDVYTKRTALEELSGSIPEGAVGQMSDFYIRVEFIDSYNNGEPTKRTFSITRRIIHG